MSSVIAYVKSVPAAAQQEDYDKDTNPSVIPRFSHFWSSPCNCCHVPVRHAQPCMHSRSCKCPACTCTQHVCVPGTPAMNAKHGYFPSFPNTGCLGLLCVISHQQQPTPLHHLPVCQVSADCCQCCGLPRPPLCQLQVNYSLAGTHGHMTQHR
jgi:hypothetical protein